MSIHPADAVAVQAHDDVELTSIAAAPPSPPKLAERGVTLKLQVGVGAGAGVETGGGSGAGAGVGCGDGGVARLGRSRFEVQ